MIGKRECWEIALVVEYVLSLALLTLFPNNSWITGFFVLTLVVLCLIHVWDRYTSRAENIINEDVSTVLSVLDIERETSDYAWFSSEEDVKQPEILKK